MNILDGLSTQLLAELLAQAILLALPLTALFLAVRSRRVAQAILKLGHVRRRMVEGAQRNGEREVNASEPNTGEAVDATRPLTRDILPMWSPDSSRLVCGTVRDDHVDLYVVDVTTGSVVRLTQALEDE